MRYWKEFIQQFPITNPSTKMLVDLSHYGIIRVSGHDAAKFLDGQLSCNVQALQPGDNTLGAYCNIKGTVDSLFRLWRQENEYYLRMLDSLVEPTLAELQKYALFSKVQLHNSSEHLCGFGVSNHKITLPMDHPNVEVLKIADNRCEIYGTFEAVSKLWHDCISNAAHVDPYIWEILDIKDHIPELYPQTVGAFFPHDLNLPSLGAVSFIKGCFRGQEIVARMEHRGKLKRKMHAFSAPDLAVPPQPADRILTGGPEQEQIAGTVVRSCRNTDGRVIGLAVISNALHTQKLFLGQSTITLTDLI